MLRTGHLVLCVFGFAHGLVWPSFVRKCPLSEFRTCGLGAANEVLPTLLRGAPEYGIPNFFPYRLGETDIEEEDLRMSLKNCELSGFETMHVYYTDFSEPITTIKFTMDTLTLTGDFPKGSHLFESILPRGGVANFTLENGKFGYEILYKVKSNPDGSKSLITYRGKVDIDPETTRYSFSEFKTGVPYLSVENSKALDKILLPKFKAALYQGFLDTATKLTDVFPLADFFVVNKF